MLEVIVLLAALGNESRFFQGGEVDFWGTRRAAEVPAGGDLWADSAAPVPARRLLEAPTKENARAYLAWQKARLERLRVAMAALEEAKQGEPAAPILYFSRPGCSWCALHEKELEGMPIVRVPAGSPLWEEHGVIVTPTLVVNGRVLRGYTPRSALLKELGRD